MKRWMLVLMMGVLPVAMTGCGGATSATGSDDAQVTVSSGEITIDGQAYEVGTVERSTYGPAGSAYKIKLSEEGVAEANIDTFPSAPAGVIVNVFGTAQYKNGPDSTGLDGLVNVAEAEQKVSISGEVSLLETGSENYVPVDFAINDFALTDLTAETRTLFVSQNRWESPGDCTAEFPQALEFNGQPHQVTYEWELQDPQNSSQKSVETIDDTYTISVFGYTTGDEINLDVSNPENRLNGAGLSLSEGFNVVLNGGGFTLFDQSEDDSCAYTATTP